MPYHNLCHLIRNAVQVAEGIVTERMKSHRELRVALEQEMTSGYLNGMLMEYLCRQDMLDAAMLARMREIENLLCEVTNAPDDQN